MNPSTLDTSPKHLWQADAPAPKVNPLDLRFSSTADEIESEDGRQTLLDRVGEGDAAQWIVQKADGSQEATSDRQLSYMGWMKSSEQRTIRVFLSSTFRDMQVERQYLVTTVFPRLRRLALTMGVQLQEIDLRWGITPEEAHKGQTVAICLSEIDRCRKSPPFFIGMLGERYGWIPDAAALEELDLAMADHRNGQASQPLRDLARREAYSVTEMEVRYGVLDSPEMQSHAFFYNRAPELTRLFAGPSGDAQTNSIYFEDSAELSARQEALKQELRARGLVRMDGYRSVEEFGRDVEQAIAAAIGRVSRSLNAVKNQLAFNLPMDWEPNQLINNSFTERHIALARLPQAQALIQSWFNPAQPENVRVLLVGSHGSGKAHEAVALAQNLVTSCLPQPSWVIPLHCRGGGITTVDSALAYIRSAITAYGAMPPSNVPARQGMVDALNAVQNYFIVQVTDIDHLQNSNDLLELICMVQNPRIAFILSSADVTQGEASAAQFQVIPMGDLDLAARERFAAQYLAIYRKSLDPELMRKLSVLPLAGSPLFLTLMLDELRHGAVFETLKQTIDGFATRTSAELAVLHSIHNWLGYIGVDPEAPGPWALVLQALCVVRHGVPEGFLLAEAGAQLTLLQWTTWSGLAEPILIEVGGYWRFTNDRVRDIVSTHYLGADTNSQTQAQVRRKLASFISTTPHPGDRTGLHELVQQLLWLCNTTGEAADVQALLTTLLQRNNVGALYVIDRSLLMDSWRMLVRHGHSAGLTALADVVVDSTDTYWPLLLCELLSEFDCWAEMETVARSAMANPACAAADALEYQLGIALVNQEREAEAVALIAPGLQAWAAHPESALVPSTCGILVGLIRDGMTDPAPWTQIIEAAVQSLMQADPAQAGEQQLVLIVTLMPLLFEQQKFDLAAALSHRGLVLSYSLPGDFGARMRLLLSFHMVCLMRMRGGLEEAVRFGYAILAQDSVPFAGELLFRARCARATGQTLLDLKRWEEAQNMLEFALQHEAQDESDFVPLLLNTAFMTKAVLELHQEERIRPLLETFAAYCPGNPGLAVELRNWLLAELRTAQRLQDAAWLEQAT